MSDLNGYQIQAPEPPPREAVIPAIFEKATQLTGKRRVTVSSVQIAALAVAAVVMVATVLFALVSTTIAGLTVRGEVIERRTEACVTNYEKMIEARVVLEQSPREEWTDDQMQTYLYNELWMVYNGMVAYEFEFDELCLSVDELVSLGYFPEVPGNPFSNWEPMSLAIEGTEFSPGDLFVLLPPPEFYSYVSDGHGGRDMKPMSYQLGIFGPTMEFASLGLAQPMPNNTWAQVPKGTYYMLGSFSETTSQSDEKRADWLRYKAEQAALEGQQEGQ